MINKLIKTISKPIIPPTMRRRLRMMLALVGQRSRRRLIFQLSLNVGLGVMEVLSIISVFPFLAVAAHPESIRTNSVLATMNDALGFTNERSFLVFLGVLLLGFTVATNVATVVVRWINSRFIENLTHELAVDLTRNYLHQPYPFFLGVHTSTFYARIAGDVVVIGDSVFRPAFEALAKAISASLICLTLFLIDPLASIVVMGVLAGGYMGIYSIIKARLTSLGNRMREFNRLKTQAMHECFSGIKVAKVMGLESHLLKQYERHSRAYAEEKVTQSVYNNVPVHAMEIFLFLLVVAGTLYVVSTFDNFAEAIPILGIYALGAFRVRPGFQTIYHAIASIRVGLPRVEGVYEHLSLVPMPRRTPIRSRRDESYDDPNNAVIMELKHVGFQYEGTVAPILRDISLTIKRNTTVGIRGATGSGKTTLIDMMLGLLAPTDGEINVEGQPLDSESAVGAWQRRVGYVPQDIYLTDGTVAENIAYGLEPKEIDKEAVAAAARMAQIADFIVNNLPMGYETTVGERGVRLSGGQRQRIGIARALYHSPDVLVFDEATSALDNETEASLMQAVQALSHKLTIIMVAHRLSTLEGCDEVIRLEHGSIVDQSLGAVLAP